MKEVFIHHIWNLKIIAFEGLKTFHGSEIEIINFGKINYNSGPDFIDAEIIIGGQLWVGNVEMHVNSSDWDLHQHSTDLSYGNVILHVVWNHDKEITFLRARNVETLIISQFVKKEVIYNYEKILNHTFNTLPCKGLIDNIDWNKISLWFERLIVERLEEKSKNIHLLYKQSNQNWEEVTFKIFALNFGLKINKDPFEIWCNSFPFYVLQKNQNSKYLIEALFFGQSGFLENPQDNYMLELKKEYDFLKHKYNLNPISSSVFNFFSLRPQGFPTIRLAQLASIYGTQKHLFSTIISFQNLTQIEEYFKKISPSEYWDTHYVFGKESKKVTKNISTSKIHNLIINTILPLKFSYEISLGQIDLDFYLSILQALKTENNSIIKLFIDTGFPIKNSKDSQVILHLKKWYCDEKKCLNCAIGREVLTP